MTLTFKLGINRVKMNTHANIYAEGHLVEKLLSRHIHKAHTTHTRPIVLPGPLNGLIINLENGTR